VGRGDRHPRGPPAAPRRTVHPYGRELRPEHELRDLQRLDARELPVPERRRLVPEHVPRTGRLLSGRRPLPRATEQLPLQRDGGEQSLFRHQSPQGAVRPRERRAGRWLCGVRSCGKNRSAVALSHVLVRRVRRGPRHRPFVGESPGHRMARAAAGALHADDLARGRMR
jgi:hypothetical protein